MCRMCQSRLVWFQNWLILFYTSCLSPLKKSSGPRRENEKHKNRSSWIRTSSLLMLMKFETAIQVYVNDSSIKFFKNLFFQSWVFYTDRQMVLKLTGAFCKLFFCVWTCLKRYWCRQSLCRLWVVFLKMPLDKTWSKYDLMYGTCCCVIL